MVSNKGEQGGSGIPDLLSSNKLGHRLVASPSIFVIFFLTVSGYVFNKFCRARSVKSNRSSQDRAEESFILISRS